jgi:chain length determinant protein EpsF
MGLNQLLLVLRARYKIAVLVLAAALAVALPVIQHLPRQYTATTSLVVDVRSPDPISAMIMPANLATQEDIIRSDRVARKVVRVLRLEESPVVRQQWLEATRGSGEINAWLAELLQRNLSISPPRRDSNIITIEYTAADPVFAANVANAFAQGYVETAIELKVEPAKQYARWFGEQSKSLRENLEQAQARLSAYQQKKGIVAKDETLDTENARLAALTTQLTTLQAQIADTRSRQRSAAATLPEVLQNSVIAGLRSDIVRLEAKLKDASGNLGRNHPQYQRMVAELEALKAKLEDETRHVTKTFSASSAVGRDTEHELKAAIEAQKRKLLELRSERDQLAVLQRDVDAARNAYEAIERRYTQTSLESQATQTNVFHLAPATEPLAPSSPKIAKFTFMAVVFGVMLGLVAAFGIELVDRRVRCADDLAQMLQLPVLTVMPRILPTKRGRLARLAFWRGPPALPDPREAR